MIAVITGSSGFIGSHLVDALLARGASVRALRRPESARLARDPRVEYAEADLLDAEAVAASAIWRGATHVFHCAGRTRGISIGDFRSGNVIPTANILAALRGRAPALRRFVLVSSQAAAGPASAPDRAVTEEDEPAPIDLYGQSKLEAEHLVNGAAEQLPASVVRPASVYGPRDGDFLKAFREATRSVGFYAAARDQVISIVHVGDLVRALIQVAEHADSLAATYFVANHEPATWDELYGIVRDVAGVRGRAFQLPAFAIATAGAAADVAGTLTGRSFFLGRNRAAMSRPKWWVCNSERIRRETGWNEELTLQEGVRQTYLAYARAGLVRAPAHTPMEMRG